MVYFVRLSEYQAVAGHFNMRSLIKFRRFRLFNDIADKHVTSMHINA
jgi:hypothetical protein